MHKSSRKSAINIYLRQQTGILSYKYSPSYKKERTRNFRVSLPSTRPHPSIDTGKFQSHPYLETKTSIKTSQVANPQKSKSKQTNSKEFQGALSSKLLMQKMKIQELQKTSRLKQEQAKRNRSIKNRLQTRQSRRSMQQFQYKYQEHQREQEIKLRRKTSEQSFIVETHRESIDMLKKSKEIRSRSEMKLTKDKYFQSEKNHEYLELKRKTTKMQQNYQLKYHKAFVKNQPFKVPKYPNLAGTLAISAKVIAAPPDKKPKLLPSLRQTPKPINLDSKQEFHTTKQVQQKYEQKNTQTQLKKQEHSQLKIEEFKTSNQVKQEIQKVLQAESKVEVQPLVQKAAQKSISGEVVNVELQEANIKNS